MAEHGAVPMVPWSQQVIAGEPTLADSAQSLHMQAILS